MATRLTDEFPARTKAPTAAYPDGSYMNETALGANDGTPLDERIGDDYEGLKQGLLGKAGITPNGQPDSVTNPQQLQAIEKFIGDGDSQLAGGSIWPLSSQESAQVGDSGLSNIELLRDASGGFLYYTEFPVSGEITALDFNAKTATIGGLTTRLYRQKGSIRAVDYISDYLNPTSDEFDFLMTCDREVIWQDDGGSEALINRPKTINFTGNTIWRAEKDFMVTFVATTADYMLNTVNNTGVCGTYGINFDCANIAEHAVQYSDCNIVKAYNGEAKNVLVQLANNFRGGWFFLSTKRVDFDGLRTSKIQQKAPAAGEFQAFSWVDVDEINGTGTCYGEDIDKLFNASGVCSGDAGTFIGKNGLDNACYVLGAPNALTVQVIADGCKQGVVYDATGPTADDASLFVKYARFSNVASRVVVPRAGNGLHIGTLVSNGSFAGISDTTYTGATNTVIDNAYLKGVTNGRAVDYANGEITIENLVLEDVDAVDFDEVARFESTAKVTIDNLVDTGGTATKCLRFQALTDGFVKIKTMSTNKLPTEYLGGTDFGGKVYIDRINGFDIEGNAPAPLTISGGVITINGSYHRVDTEGGAATDDIDTINGAPSVGAIVTIQSQSNVRDPILKHDTGNLWLPNGADIRLNAQYDRIRLRWDGTYWSPSL